MKTTTIQKNVTKICFSVAAACAFNSAFANPETSGKAAQTTSDSTKSAPKEAAPKAAAPASATPAAEKKATTDKKAAAETTLSVDGLIHKVVAKKKEIYVNPADGSKKMEFYFPETAQFLKAGQPVGFDALKEGQRVRVSYTKTGKRLNPSKAEILD